MHQTVDRDGAELLPVDARLKIAVTRSPSRRERLNASCACIFAFGIGQEFCLLLITSFEITS